MGSEDGFKSATHAGMPGSRAPKASTQKPLQAATRKMSIICTN